MKVNIGSKNQTKVGAVGEMLKEYPQFGGAEVIPFDVNVKTYDHPISLEKTVQGAIDRAKGAFQNCDLSFGIEGGLIEVPNSKTGYMEVAACAIYDGNQFHLGLSSAYEWPKAVTDGIVNKGLDGSQALKEAGLTSHEKIGTAEGGISILTDGRLNRKEYNKQAVRMALIHLEHPELYV